MPGAGAQWQTQWRKIPALRAYAQGKGRDQFLNENWLIFIWYKLTLYLLELSHPKMCIGAVYIHFTKVRTEDRPLIKRKLYAMC